MQDLIRADPSFTPRELFARMQGAWLEPRQGSMWQENTGVTPTTSGGQTIGLLLGLDQGAVYGNNLVASTISDAGWGDLPATPASIVSGDQLTFGGLFSGRRYQVNTTTEGKIYELRFTIRRISGNTNLYFFHEGSASGNFTLFSITDASTTYSVKVLGRSGSGLVSFGIQDRNVSGHGTIEITNISVRQILGNHASQATAANRPLFGARRNLLTYSEQLDNAVWPTTGGLLSRTRTGPTYNSAASWYLVENTGATYHGIFYNPGFSGTAGATYRYSVIAKAGTRTWMAMDAGGDGANISYFDLANGVTGNKGSGATTSITALTDGFYLCTVVRTLTNAANIYLSILMATGNGGAIYTGDNSSGMYVWGADIRLNADADKDPAPYQRITTATDYDAGRFPAIRHADSTDVLTATLPAINVRRNLLTYSEDFTNAAWVKNQTTIVQASVYSPFGVAYLYSGLGVAGGMRMTQASAVANGSTAVLSALVKSTGASGVSLEIYGGSPLASRGIGRFSGSGFSTISTANSPVAATVSPGGDGWYLLQLVCNIQTGYAYTCYLNPNEYSGSNNGACSVYLVYAQLELGSVATNYQKITDWTSEQYSSSGSTYFSTPSGMSCLHNQSLGTSYNLPALQTDIYGTVITPARLAPPLEQRLALYMHRLAGLADADFFWQEQATDGMTGQLLADDNDTILLRG